MPVTYQLVIDCAAPDVLARFWAEALHYVLEPPPEGYETWDDFYRSIGVPEEELGLGADSISDPNGEGPRIWFQVVPDRKIVLKWAANEGAEQPGYQTTVTMEFTPLDGDTRTLVSITEEGWRENEAALGTSYGNCMGWSQMLAAMKVWVEHGINLREGMYK